MPDFTTAELTTQLKKLNTSGFGALLTQFGKEHGVGQSFFYAIASRETNCMNILGDKQKDGSFAGVGIVQIDIQHPIARQARDSGTWKTNPGPLIEFGATLLAMNAVQVKHLLPQLTGNDALKVVASGYNCGVGQAIRGAKTKSGDSDIFTTGHDYGKDVIARMLVFDQLLAAK